MNQKKTNLKNKWVVNAINIYQSRPSTGIKKCRFYPTCSEYSKECFKEYNFFYASILTVKRLLKCNRFHKMAYDPVPIKKKYRTKYKTLEECLALERIKRSS